MYLTRQEEHRLFGLLNSKEAIAIIGPRRAGKTTIAKRLLEQFVSKGKEGKYFDLEAIGAPSTISSLLKEIKKIPKGALIILDEIQEINGWVKLVRNEIEYETHKLIITGSSATLLSSEIASSLAGRAIPISLLTLSYKDAKQWGLKNLEQYMQIGGYPECILRPSEAAKLHKLYFELTILRDVAARKGIREIKPLLDLATVLVSEPGKTISSKKTSSMLGISQPTYRSYVQALDDAFLILSIPPYKHSPREKVISDSRHYSYDVGLQNSVTISANADFGRRIENVVAIELVRRGYRLSYLETDKGECDFIAQKLGHKKLAIQVWGGYGKIPEREIAGLKIGMKKCNAQGLFLSYKPVQFSTKEKNIKFKTLEEWLLE